MVEIVIRVDGAEVARLPADAAGLPEALRTVSDADNANGSAAPAVHAVAVTPSDTVDLVNVSRALYVGGAGDVKVNMLGGESAVVFTAVPAGTILPVRATRVWATTPGSAATAIVALR